MTRRSMLFILAVFIIFLLSACSKGSQKSSTQNPDSEPVGVNEEQNQVKADSVKNEFKGFEGEAPAVLSGSGNQEQKLAMEKGYYFITMKSKDPINGLTHFAIQESAEDKGFPIYTSAGAGLDESGWSVYDTIERIYNGGEKTLKVEAKGEYRIEIRKFPITSEKVEMPALFKGTGKRILGPVDLNGNIKIRIKTEDAKEAGFTAKLLSGDTGESVQDLYMNIDKEKKGINRFDESISSEVPSGSYMIEVSANAGCVWEIEVNQ